jgi:uncharacterized damage-inducible protein DinB
MSVAHLAPVSVMPAEALLAHWQGHRRLTRKLIEAFPEDKLFSHAIGGMRPFGVMAMELISMAGPMARGIATNEWETLPPHDTSAPLAKPEVLRLWDEGTAAIDTWWPQIPQGRFTEQMTAFGMYPGQAYDLLLYVIDNEIHHRGQGYVYLRSLGITPPLFFERC